MAVYTFDLATTNAIVEMLRAYGFDQSRYIAEEKDRIGGPLRAFRLSSGFLPEITGEYVANGEMLIWDESIPAYHLFLATGTPQTGPYGPRKPFELWAPAVSRDAAMLPTAAPLAGVDDIVFAVFNGRWEVQDNTAITEAIRTIQTQIINLQQPLPEVCKATNTAEFTESTSSIAISGVQIFRPRGATWGATSPPATVVNPFGWKGNALSNIEISYGNALIGDKWYVSDVDNCGPTS